MIRMHLVDWFAVASHCNDLRILQAKVEGSATLPIIDATEAVSVIAGPVRLREDSVVQLVEIFSGGFCGWSQASTVISQGFLPTRMRWLLDREPHCIPGAKIAHGDLHTVSNASDLTLALRGDLDMFIQADIADSWWYRALALPQIQAWCTSPPCPPFSTASSGAGVTAPDGKALLHVLALAEVFRPPMICIEQVSGFKQHPHFGFCQGIWEFLGYKMVWSDCINLLDVAPTSRPRFLGLLVRDDALPPTPLCSFRLALPPRPSLGSFGCLVDLPPCLQQPCELGNELLQIYLSPEFLPGSSHATASCNPAAYRIRGPNDRAGCFMASYQF